jgi:hypothetical protein
LPKAARTAALTAASMAGISVRANIGRNLLMPRTANLAAA